MDRTGFTKGPDQPIDKPRQQPPIVIMMGIQFGDDHAHDRTGLDKLPKTGHRLIEAESPVEVPRLNVKGHRSHGTAEAVQAKLNRPKRRW